MEQVDLRVICIGNLLHGNDGLGQAVLSRLYNMHFPAQVELMDGGIGGLTLLPHFKHASRLLIIDMMKSELPEGSVHMFENIVPNLPFEMNSKFEHGGDLSTLLQLIPIFVQPVPMVDLLCVSASEAVHFDQSMYCAVIKAVDEVCNIVDSYVTDIVNESLVRH